MLRSSSSIESDLPPTQRATVAVEALSYYEDEANKRRLATLKQYTSTDRKNSGTVAEQTCSATLIANPRFLEALVRPQLPAGIFRST